MSIIDSDIKALVRAVEEPGLTLTQINGILAELVVRVKLAVARPEVKLRYDSYSLPRSEEMLQIMPLDERGYLRAFDILEEEAAFYQAWHQYGIVASHSAVPVEVCEEAVATAHRLTLALSNGACDLDKPETWQLLPRDKSGEPILTRGFFELYHDRAMAALRQAVRIYLHYVVIWGRAELWTTFDRLGIKLPGHEESGALPLHVDQNPNVHPDFRTVQGVLALRDCPAERGTFVGVPGSRQHFQAYGAMAKNSGEYVELDTASAAYGLLAPAAQACPLAQGSLVSWDSRTTHANSANLSALTRYVAYIAAGPACPEDAEAIAARVEALKTGIGKNVRNAKMHASKPPRYTAPEVLAARRQAENLTLLGELVYGTRGYDSI
jgi:Phytanoyl-CoA dioxygenase (PhyH)